MELKYVFAGIAVFLSFVAMVPYWRDMFRGRTQPHAFTFLIWSLTVGIATAVLWYGGGGFGALGGLATTVTVFATFLLSIRYGTRNIRFVDVVVLILALVSIGIWLYLNDPLLALLMVTSIDLFGYLPTYRKSFEEPWTETLSSWWLAILTTVFSLLALMEYNVLTLTYLIMTIVANAFVIVICRVRRGTVRKPAWKSR